MGKGWNPEEHYIWIEPNIKYLLSTPDSYKHAPIPWYNRPPPQPLKPLPKDKLRFLSTRKIHDSFKSTPRWTQSVADDLDSASQTLLTVFLSRVSDGKDNDIDAESVRGMYASLGTETVHYLREARYVPKDTFGRISKRVKKRREEEEEERAAASSSEEPWSSVDMDGGPDDGTVEAEGIEVVAEALFKLLDINEKQLWRETKLAEHRRQGEEKERVERQYEEYISAMEALKVDAEALVRQREGREMRRVKAGEGLNKATEAGKAARRDDSEDEMEVVVHGFVSRTHAVERSDSESTDEDAPPTKRVRKD